MNKLFSFKNILVLLAIYLVTVILIFIVLKLVKTTENDVLKALIYSIFFSLIAFISLIDFPIKTKLTSGKNLLRYSMLCKKCGWEWMSHSTGKAIHPVQCPKCGNSKKAMIELVGWRKFDLSSSKDRDLRHFMQ